MASSLAARPIRRAAARLIKCAASSALHPASQRCLPLPRARPGCAHRRALSPRQIMFSFFKRFKGSKESDNAPEESQTAPEALAPEPAVEAPQAPVAPSAPQPVTPVRVDTQPAAAASANEPEAEAPALETVEIVPPPMQDANAKRSWLTRLKTGDRRAHV